MFHPPTFAMKSHLLKTPTLSEELSKRDELDFYLEELSNYTSLSHKNLVSVYDIYVRNDTIYVCIHFKSKIIRYFPFFDSFFIISIKTLHFFLTLIDGS